VNLRFLKPKKKLYFNPKWQMVSDDVVKKTSGKSNDDDNSNGIIMT
jgi:hypothetical protein